MVSVIRIVLITSKSVHQDEVLLKTTGADIAPLSKDILLLLASITYMQRSFNPEKLFHREIPMITFNSDVR